MERATYKDLHGNNKECVKCNAVWCFEDYVCPVCDSCAVDSESVKSVTHEYVPIKNPLIKSNWNDCDVIRILDLTTNKYL